jgi:hypothetical protein
MVNVAPDFTEHPNVINGCSDLLVEVLGERGRANGMTVEVELILRTPLA